MNQISLDAKGGQFLADLANWQRESAPDNSADLERLRRNLRFARQQVLTKRQQQMLELYYDQGLTMGQIAANLTINSHRAVLQLIHFQNCQWIQVTYFCEVGN